MNNCRIFVKGSLSLYIKIRLMTKLIAILLTLSISFSVWSQQNNFKKPAYNLIRVSIFDNGSPFFYPNLFDRYMQGDTSLTVEDFRHLYYGYTFQSKYIPYQESKYEAQILSYLKKGRLSSTELDKFIKVVELKLKDLPYDIRTLNILAFSYAQKKDSTMNAITLFKKNMLTKAILSSGDGRTEKTAFHVIDPFHERDILNELGYKYAGSSNLSNALCDYLIVQPNERNVRGVYFDISRLLKVRSERQQN